MDISDDESDENIEDINGKKIYLNNLMRQVNDTAMINIRQSFLKYINGNIKENQLRDILKPYNIVFSNKKFHPLFSKIDVKKKGTVNFLEFVTYLVSEFEIKRKYNAFLSNADTELSKLIPKLLPNKLIEYGKEGIIQFVDIVFLPNKIKQSQKKTNEPEYIAASRSGKIVRYKPDMQWKTTHQIVSNLSSIMVNGLVAMPELGVICLSLTGGQLMFYDMLSGQFKPCLVVELWPGTLTTHLAHVYEFCERKKIGLSKIAIGDQGGTVSVLEFASSDKLNPFKDIPCDDDDDDDETPAFDFLQLLRRTAQPPPGTAKPSICAYLYDRLHSKPVEQIAFYNAGRSFASVSQSSRGSMVQCNVQSAQCEGRRPPSSSSSSSSSPSPSPPFHYTHNADGFSCVCAVHGTQLATGSLDRTVSLWNVKGGNHAPGPAHCTELSGHSCGVMRVSHNTVNGHLYSVSMDSVVKVWDVRRAACLLTFDGLAVAAGPDTRQRWPYVVMHFNWFEQTIVTVSKDDESFVTVECTRPTVTAGQEPSQRRPDDKSHETPVVKTMYNALYRVLISTSAADSSIAVWNLRTGDVIIQWSMAHTEEVYCEVLPVEITAANFDPSGGLLVTGALNGSVNMWDPNTGACLNRLRIPSGDRISEVFWLPNKILVTGLDHRVTEFNDPLLLSKGKVWLSHHEEPVLSACVKLPSLFVTTTQAGVMGFWRLETGQLTKKYKARMRPDTRKTKNSSSSSKSQMASTMVSKSQISSISYVGSRIIGDGDAVETREERLKRLDIKHTPREHYAAVATHFLRARPECSNVGNLLVATRNGVVQIWCTHKVPKYISQFVAIHIANDYVTSMVSDLKSEYLITSFESGYIKTWLVTNFGQPRHTIYDVNMPSLRLRFPFLIIIFFMGRAERAASKNTDGPLLVSAYRAHLQRINHVEFIEKLELIVSSSVDKMIRIWTLAGHFVGTLGMAWPSSMPKVRPVNVTHFKIPPDIQREASFTTIQVLKDGVNASLRSTAVWDKLELLRQQRVTQGKKGKRKLHNKKCPDLPLHDTHQEFLRTKTASITRPVVIKIDESKPRIKIYKHVPLCELDNIPVIPKLEKTKEESTPRTKLIFFK